MSIEQEALNMIEGFIVGERPTLKYTSEVKEPKVKERRLYRKVLKDNRTSASDLFTAIVKIKEGNVPEGLTENAQAQLAEDIKVFQIVPTKTTVVAVEAFMLSKKMEYQLEAAKKKQAEKDAKKVA